ncbi:MAG: helix-turn-helix transcriptional regulator [Treponema sp.]|nr:helix-turn-helix transcriptional regulator [Treponema sp.]
MESIEIQKRVSENLRKIRKSKKMTQLDLAIKCDMSEAMIKNIELNRSWPSEKTLSQITNALGIDVYRLFLPLAIDFEKEREIKLSVKDEITKCLRKYLEEKLNSMELR